MDAVTIIVVTSRADRHADASRADTHAHTNFFRARRHGTANSHNRNRGYCKTLDHRMLLDVDEIPVRKCGIETMVPEKRIGKFRQIAGYLGTYVFIANQIASATSTSTIPPHITGVTFLELPLRGESFGAWL
jgi:hypothetical protein